jgi:TolA-binding protein
MSFISIIDENRKWAAWSAAGLIVVLSFFAVNALTPKTQFLLEKGERDFRGKNYFGARQKFEKVIKISPKSSGQRCEAEFFYALSFAQEGHYAEGAGKLREFIKDYPGSSWTPQAYFELAGCEKNLGNGKTARPIYEKIIRDYPFTPWAVYARDQIKQGNK